MAGDDLLVETMTGEGTGRSATTDEETLSRLAAELRAFDDNGPIGIYAHGSFLLGGVNRSRSDLDLLYVRKTALRAEERVAHLCFWLERSRRLAPKGVEVHVLDVGALKAHALTSYELHFSDGLREQAEREIRSGRLTAPFIPGTDPELPGYLALIRQRGHAVFGAAATELIPLIPPSDVLRNMLNETNDARQRLRMPKGGTWRPTYEYGVLNACRTLRFAEEGRFSSKIEGGAWALGRTPRQFRHLIEEALRVQTGDETAAVARDDPQLEEAFFDWAACEAKKAASALSSGDPA